MKYAFRLELENTDFDYSVLSKFRDHLLQRDTQKCVLDMMLEHF